MEKNDAHVISAYLDAVAQAERAYDQRGGRLASLLRLRAQELYWTVTRLLRQAGARLSRLLITRRKKPPSWSRVEAPVVQSTAGVAGEGRARLLIDMTSTLRSGKNTGIQRVAREMGRNGWEIGAAIPVAIHDGRLLSYYRREDIPETIALAAGDVFVMADASWNHLDEYLPILADAKAKGAISVVCLYDILPLLYPSAFPPHLTQRFGDWMRRVVLTSDGVIADSRAAADSLRDYVLEGTGAPPAFPIAWWRLGADFPAGGDAPSARARRIADGRPYFLGVGTVEPRKGYPVALDAVEKLWAEGADASYVIVGGRGWGMRAFEKRLARHPEFGKRLFWLDRAGDADLALLYRNARAMVLASFAEGFGLPIVEAAHYGTPVIASDIAVFHEAAGESAHYFPVLDRDRLADLMRGALLEKPRAPVVAAVSWRDSATQLFETARAFQARAHERFPV